jgi:hypothetical protein
VQLRQIAVGHDHVVTRAWCAERLLAIESEVDGNPLASEPDRDGRGEFSVVFNDQNTRRAPPRSAALRQDRPGAQSVSDQPVTAR